MASKFYELLERMIDRLNHSIKSINGVTPNTNGEVTITDPVNLLINSDFRNPVNQQGLTEYTGVSGMTIDCWYLNDRTTSEKTVSIVEGEGVRGTIVQKKSMTKADSNGPYTLAAMIYSSTNNDYKTLITTGGFSTGNEVSDSKYGKVSIRYKRSDNEADVCISCNDDCAIVWAALYKGYYAVQPGDLYGEVTLISDTLPDYVPKDYFSELAECYKYYRVFNFTNYVAAGISTSEFICSVDLGNIPMASQPTVTMTTLPTSAKTGSSSYTIAITESTIALQNYVNGSTVLNVYAKSSKTGEYIKNRPVLLNAVGLVFDARPQTT